VIHAEYRTAHKGFQALGTWTLTVQDLAAGNTGTVEAWSITFNTLENGSSVPYVK